MDFEVSKLKLLERMLLDADAEPTRLPLSLLKNITNNFSDDRKIGSGGFSVVYKGLLQNGTVAVKKLSQMADIDEKIFKQEVTSMTMAKHKNIVRFLGYCADTQGEVENYKGKVVIADVRQRLLCFEFFPNGSLDGYITDASEGFEWRTRYKIIKGICEGLHYLHQKNIVHLDLKPANILLNYNMVPKISDFGLSRCFDEKQSRTITSKLIGTLGYLAPESYGGKITVKSDIYSLGVIIIEILTGQKGYPEIENVLESWECRSKKSDGDTQLEQVRVCTRIAVECIDYNPDKRPKTQDIIETLDEMERTYGFIEPDLCTSSAAHEKTCSNDWQQGTPKVQGETSSEAKASSSICEVDKVQSMAVSASPSQLPLIISVPKGSGETSTEICSLGSSENTKLLDIHPMELRFPFEPNKLIECPVTMTNGTDHYVGSWIIPTNQDTHSNLCFPCSSLFYTVEPRSTLVVYMTVKEQQQQPLPPRDTGMFEVLMIIMDSKEDLRNLKSSIGIMPSFDDDFLRRVKELGGGVHRVMLTAVICDPASCLEVIYNQKFIPVTSEYGDVSCIDVHPIETWLLVGHRGGCVSIWNYKTQEKGIELVTKRSGMLSLFTHPCLVCSAKFITKEKWFATGDGDGWVHVYAYTKDRVKEFKAHHGRHISSMAVHPTKPFLLTSSFTDTLIKLWDWSQGWKCTQTFDVPNMHVCRLKWNPCDNNTFASVCSETVIVWEIHSADPTATLVGSKKADFLYNDNNRHFMVTSVQGTKYCAYIEDLQTGECVHKLGMVNRIIGDVACHPTHPILVTSGLYDETVCLWDARTFRLEKTIHFTEYVQDMLFIDTKDSARLFVRCKNGIANVEINMPSLKTDLRTGCGSEEVHPHLPGSN